jgi:hypothetical protein
MFFIGILTVVVTAAAARIKPTMMFKAFLGTGAAPTPRAFSPLSRGRGFWPPPEHVITISPSGLKGYYLLGISSYLKDTYDLSKYVFSGASSGAWIALIMAYRGENHTQIIADVLEASSAPRRKSIRELGKSLRDMFFTKYKTADFDMSRVHIGITEIKPEEIAPGEYQTVANTKIYTNFATLEDAINCCIASSHVPFVMGTQLFRKYDNRDTIDGGFSSHPYLKKDARLHIYPFIWYSRPVQLVEILWNRFMLFLDLFRIHTLNLKGFYYEGYRDAAKNRGKFDDIFCGDGGCDISL